MEINYTTQNGRESAKITIADRCAVHEAEEIRQGVKEVYEKGIYHVLFDMRECTFIDSTGLGMLVSVHKQCQSNGGKMVLFSVNSDVKDLLRMTRLESIFEIVY